MTRVLHLEIERCCNCPAYSVCLDTAICQYMFWPDSKIEVPTEIHPDCPLPNKESEASDGS